MTFLESELRRASEGACSCVLVAGEGGVGKTRLAGELLARHPAGVLRLSARAYPLGSTAAFGLWAEALERHFRGLAAEEVVRVCGGVLDDLAALLRSVAAVRGSIPEGEASRLRLLEGLAVVLSNLTGDGPVVVVLDDVHLADASSWEALQYLAHNLPDAPLLVVAAARPAELAEHEVAGRVLFSLEQEGFLTRLELHPLDSGALGELAQALLGRAPPPALVDWLSERCRGNPLFTIGLLRALEVEGADLSHPRLRKLPEGLVERVGERLKGLDAPARSTLEILATIGRRVEFGELVEASGSSPEELALALEGLARRRCVLEEEQGPELIYEVSHPLITEAVYQAIGRARRRPLHRRIGRALVAAGQLGEAAPHFAAAAEPGDAEAIDVLTDALRQAEGRGAYREALTILGSLVDVLPSGDERWLMVAEAMSFEAEWVVDHRADLYAALAIKALRAIEAAMGPDADPARRAAIQFRLASFLGFGTGDLDEARAACRQAIVGFEAVGDERRAMIGELELGWVDWCSVLVAGSRVAPRAEQAGDRFVAMQALGRSVGYGALLLGRLAEAEAAFERAAVLAREERRAYFQALAEGGRATTLAFQGRVTEARRVIEEVKAMPDWRDTMLPELQGITAWLAGDLEAARAGAEESLVWSAGRLSRRRAQFFPFAVVAALEADRLEDAHRYLAVTLAAFAGRPWLCGLASCQWAGAILAWRENGPDAAIDGLRAAAVDLEARQTLPLLAFTLVDLAEAAAACDRADLAQDAAGRLTNAAEAIGYDLFRGLAALARAWVDLASARPAANAAAGAADELGATGCRLFHGRALDALGRALSRSERPEAVRALDEAARIFEACGARWRLDRTLGALAGLGSRGRRAAAAVTGPESLTGRERQVARLAAQGHTVRQIAERLYISHRTVETHLANVYAKLGVTSKADLVGRAAELET